MELTVVLILLGIELIVGLWVLFDTSVVYQERENLIDYLKFLFVKK